MVWPLEYKGDLPKQWFPSLTDSYLAGVCQSDQVLRGVSSGRLGSEEGLACMYLPPPFPFCCLAVPCQACVAVMLSLPLLLPPVLLIQSVHSC